MVHSLILERHDDVQRTDVPSIAHHRILKNAQLSGRTSISFQFFNFPPFNGPDAHPLQFSIFAAAAAAARAPNHQKSPAVRRTAEAPAAAAAAAKIV